MRVLKLGNGMMFGMSLLLVTAGCGGGPVGGGAGTGTGTEGGTLYVTVQSFGGGGGFGQPDVFLFPANTNGNVIPANITSPADVDLFAGLAVDSQGDVYVGADTISADPSQVNEILVYAPGAKGTATPKRTIIGTLTGLAAIDGAFTISSLAVDGAGNIYVASDINVCFAGANNTTICTTAPAISVFSSTANGDAVPTRVISGSATNLDGGVLTVDSGGNIYTVGSNAQGGSAILIFDPSADGNVPPTSTLAGSDTMIDDAAGVALDGSGNIYVSNGNQVDATPSILEFRAGSTGNVAPIRVISGSATTMIGIGAICLDSSGNVYVINFDNILKFGPNAAGNVAPDATISVPPPSILFGANSIAVR